MIKTEDIYTGKNIKIKLTKVPNEAINNFPSFRKNVHFPYFGLK